MWSKRTPYIQLPRAYRHPAPAHHLAPARDRYAWIGISNSSLLIGWGVGSRSKGVFWALCCQYILPRSGKTQRVQRQSAENALNSVCLSGILYTRKVGELRGNLCNSHMVKKEEQFGSISGINISVLSPLRLKISIEYCALRTYSDVAGDSSLSDDTRHYNFRLKLGSSGSGNSLCKP